VSKKYEGDVIFKYIEPYNMYQPIRFHLGDTSSVEYWLNSGFDIIHDWEMETYPAAKLAAEIMDSPLYKLL
jgi:hypothetical protein